MATIQSALPLAAPTQSIRRFRTLDFSLILGVTIALGATIAGIHASGIGLDYFLQPTGAVIVLGGTLGVLLITTPRQSLLHAIRRVVGLISTPDLDRQALIEEILYYARAARRGGLLGLEPLLPQATNPVLRDALQYAIDVGNRGELQAVLDSRLRMTERQGETDAKALEVAGGFAPTLGIVGTVVGLIEVMMHFSDVKSVGYGIGTAFVSTLYGLALANLVLLPAAHRIRARVAETFELHELVMEGVLAISDVLHPTLIRTRLSTFLREKPAGHDA